jgi:hypothetical protein
MKIIIVGAATHIKNTIEFNNRSQASHDDLMKFPDCNIECYDMTYVANIQRNGINYISKAFVLEDTSVLSDELNIVVEFCNLLDENFVNHGNHGKHAYLSRKEFGNKHKVVFLACGCSWNRGFPIDCIKYIIDQNMYTPCDACNLDDLLYTISIIQKIYDENKQDIMLPYIIGLYDMMGTIMWRGEEFEEVLRKLIQLSIHSSEVDCELLSFVNHEKKWNHIKWSKREDFNRFIYGHAII